MAHTAKKISKKTAPSQSQEGEAPEVESTPEPLRQLAQSRFKQAEYVRNVFAVNADRGTTLKQMLNPSYWAHIAHMLKPRDEVIVWVEDNSLRVEFIVVGTGKLYAQVEIKGKMELTDFTPISTNSPYTVDWSGGHGKWRVMRGSDVIKEGFDNEKDAVRWCNNHSDALDR